jgi:tetratricopeptide (TPR) repeat protein/SAM-dependent methyltransferase
MPDPVQSQGTPSLAEILQHAVRFHQQGQTPEAERLYRHVLSVAPDQFDALHLLGLLAMQQGRNDEGVRLVEAALRVNPSSARALFNLGVGLIHLGRANDAVASFDRALAINPGHLEAIYNRGVALEHLGRYEQAIASFDTVLAGKADHVEALCNRSVALEKLGRHEEALAGYDGLLAIVPNHAEAFYGRGNVLGYLGRFDDAIASFRKARALRSDHADADYNCGLALARLGRYDEAIACFEAALKIKPNHDEALVHLAKALLVEGETLRAADAARRGLAIQDTKAARDVFVHCARSLRSVPIAREFQDLVLRALSEPWCRPVWLAPVAAALVKLDDVIGEGCRRARHSPDRPSNAEQLLGPEGFSAIAGHRLLRCLLESTPICDIELEQLLTALREAVLVIALGVTTQAASEEFLGFCCALARQCFITEYAFRLAASEFEQAQRLRDRLAAALASAEPPPILTLVAVAAYFPLHSVPRAEALLRRRWPEAVGALVAQQVREPLDEQDCRASIPRLTVIDDAVSQQVQRQYEENPYPRWVKAGPVDEPMLIDHYIRTRFPAAPYRPIGKGALDILIAGCGTGQQPIETARRFVGAHVLAVDLSLASLGHAIRKTSELGLDNVEYAQADIVRLGSIGRTFDVIEASGVLHHLADPLAGWRILLSLLRPCGFMRLGLYSEIARRDIVAARAFIAERGFGPTAEDIRRCRQELMTSSEFSRVAETQDFFSISACRDLLFHVQEHRFGLPEIEVFLAESDLQFVGFELDPQIVRQYAREFPADKRLIDLGLWRVFEGKYPDTFRGMYDFWIQKAG